MLTAQYLEASSKYNSLKKHYEVSEEPSESGMLEVGDGHSIYWEERGNPEGDPIVFLHGGPGSGASPWWRGFFNPEKYRIIMFDQRGAKRSIPHASLENNTTQHLIEDMERLKDHLNIDKWSLYGHSWGSTLALSYTDSHPESVSGIVISGIFLARDSELKELYFQDGVASAVYPEVFEKYISVVPEDKRDNPIKAYGELFKASNKEVAYEALDAWTRLENKVTRLYVGDDELDEMMEDKDYVLAHSLLEQYYFENNGFIDGDNLVKTIGEKVKDIPLHIVQARYDMVCPFKTAWELHKSVPTSKLHVVDCAGHGAGDADVVNAIVGATDELSEFLNKQRSTVSKSAICRNSLK